MTIYPVLFIYQIYTVDFYDEKDENLSQTKNHFKGGVL